MANKKISIKSIILIVLAVLLVLPLVINFVNYNMSAGGESDLQAYKLFNKDLNTAIEEMDGPFFWTLTKIGTIVALIAGLTVAVLEVLKILTINLAFIENIAALVAAVAGLVVLVAFLIFCIMNTEKAFGMRTFFSGAIGWYFAWIPAIAIGALSLKAKKD